MNLPESSKKILEKSLGGNEALEQAERAQAVLENIFVGVWSVELDEGKPPRMYGDARMRELLGVADKQLTAEELYHAWFDRIHPDYVALVEDAVRQMVDGKHAEVRYPWIHPTLGEMMVRCGGRRSPFYKGGVRVSGVHRDVSALLSNALTAHADETPVEAKVETRPSLFTRDWESRVSRQFWEEISRMTPDPIFVLDAENEWRCCYSNPAHQDLVGVDPTNRTLQENFGSSLGAAMMRENEKVLAAGAPVQMRIVPAETDLGTLFEECRTIFGPNCVKSGLTMNISVTPDMPLVSLDRGRIRQVLFNLLGNAIKFTPAGSITLAATIRPITENLGELHLVVADTGVGIAAEDHERVFGMFEQTSGLRGTRVAQSGTGLGLALCRRLVECMGGKITLASELGKGSVFTVELPNVPIISRKEKASPLAANTKPAVSYAGRVLVVDDVALNLMVIKLMLQRAGIDHVVASSADKALEILEGDPHVTAVLTDLWMPHMSGVELATHIRGRYAGRDLKIAAVTADTDIMGSDDAKVFDAVLLKPVTVSQICKFLGV